MDNPCLLYHHQLNLQTDPEGGSKRWIRSGDSSFGVGEDPIGAAASGRYHAVVNYLLVPGIMLLLLLIGAGYCFGGHVVGEIMLGLILWTGLIVLLPGALNRRT
jgi:hypothetical protein